MKMKRHFNVVKINRMDFLLKYNVLILMFALFLSGLIIGSSMFKNENSLFQNLVENLFIRLHASRSMDSMLSIFTYSILMNMAYIASAFTFGMCLIGVPIICSLPFIRGLSYGIITGYMYKSFGLDGVGNFALTILPGAVFAVSLLLISCNESYKNAVDLLRMVTRGSQIQGSILKRYLSFYLLIIGFSFLASLIDMVLVKIFSPLFVLF